MRSGTWKQSEDVLMHRVRVETAVAEAQGKGRGRGKWTSRELGNLVSGREENHSGGTKGVREGKRYSSRKGGRRMAACAAERARNREQGPVCELGHG